MIEKYDLIYQSCRNYGGIAYMGSWRISIINSSNAGVPRKERRWFLSGLFSGILYYFLVSWLLLYTAKPKKVYAFCSKGLLNIRVVAGKIALPT